MFNPHRWPAPTPEPDPFPPKKRAPKMLWTGIDAVSAARAMRVMVEPLDDWELQRKQEIQEILAARERMAKLEANAKAISTAVTIAIVIMFSGWGFYSMLKQLWAICVTR